MTAITTAISGVVTAAAGWISTYLNMITAEGNDILLFFTLLPVVGIGIGLLRRLISVN